MDEWITKELLKEYLGKKNNKYWLSSLLKNESSAVIYLESNKDFNIVLLEKIE